MIPYSFKPFLLESNRYIRLGSKNDGGYVVDLESIKNSRTLVSFCICDNWEFEKDFKKKINTLKLFLFDNQTSIKFFIKRIFTSILKFNLYLGLINLIKLIDFIRIKKFFTKVTIGIAKNELSLSEILSRNKLTDNIFLKCDIEGSEYRILDEIIENQTKFSGIAIEFHDVDLHLSKIKTFINHLDLKICHIHPNNFSNVINGIPISIEMTFTRNVGKKRGLFNKLDFPNNKFLPEILIEFEQK